ncbi:MAG: squalene/phytoene synthase family protein [Alphaproteobacteria bacterium]|nr:squalene/phytoene synthase family protein [Alphaproteobacteria bacterium]
MGEAAVPGSTPRDAIAACEAIAARNDSTLFHASRALPRFRRDLFAVTYAAMRVIDDRVDEDFLSLSTELRDAQRLAIVAEVEAWRRQTAEGAHDGPLPVAIATAFRALVAPSDLGPGPWNGLAAALQEDAAEATMADWQAFDRYAQGATVAPAEIFIYLLAADETPAGARCRLPHPLAWYAADLAVFCYLVHILRDLAKDAGATPRLVTIPETVLTEVGLSRQTVGAAVASGDRARLDRLAAPILAKAEAHRRVGRERIATLLPSLGVRERLALDGLVTVYERLHREFAARYGDRVTELPALEHAARAAIFEA